MEHQRLEKKSHESDETEETAFSDKPSLDTLEKHVYLINSPEATETSLFDATRAILSKVDLFICGLCSELFTNYFQLLSHKESACKTKILAADVTLEWLSKSLFAAAVRRESLRIGSTGMCMAFKQTM
jgi:hypothetical protein